MTGNDTKLACKRPNPCQTAKFFGAIPNFDYIIWFEMSLKRALKKAYVSDTQESQPVLIAALI